MSTPNSVPIGSPVAERNPTSPSDANTEVLNNNMDVDSSLAEASVTHSNHADVDADMKIAYALLKSSIRDVSLFIASAPVGVELTNARITLASKAKDLDMMKAIMESMADDVSPPASVSLSAGASDMSETSVSKTTSATVPKLSLFQWEGQIFNRAAGNQIFPDLKACIQHFEDIMTSHCLNLDNNFVRLLPPLLSPTARIWYDGFLSNYRMAHAATPTWKEVATAFTARYGLNIHEERANCARELSVIKMLPDESIENFIDRFNTLRHRAVDQVLPNSILIDTFGRALPAGLYEKVAVAVTPLDDARKYDLDIITAFARDFYNKFYKNGRSSSSSASSSSASTSGRTSPSASTSSVKRSHVQASFADDDVHAPSRKSKYAHAYTPGTGSSSTSSPSPRSPKNNRLRSVKYCSYHRVNTHNTENCRAAAGVTGASSSSSSEDRTCRRCGVSGWSPSHVCNTAARASRPPPDNQDDTPRRFAGMTLADSQSPNTNVPTPTVSSDANISPSSFSVVPLSDITSSDMEVDVALEIAEQAQKCKFHEIYSVPPDNKSNMLILPVIIENIQTYAILDTGSTFSIISPSFASAINATITPTSGNIQLGHSNAIEPRHGSTSLTIFYNNKIHQHTFEIFDIFTTINNANIPCLIGMDLMSTLQIGITGLIISHFDIDKSNPFPPAPIDPSSLAPNNSPYGTDKERAHMFEILQPLLEQNSAIDVSRTYCNLPGAIVRLPTKPGCVAYTKQFPLPYAFKESVLTQIALWEKESVIEPAPSHTGFNSPLLVVSKKDLDGVYSFKKPRIVADVRNLNSILEITDTQSFPLISEIHSRIGHATIHSIIDIRSCFNSFLVAAEDRHKLSFTCPYTNRAYSFVKCCFGITFVGNLVQRVLQELFHDLPYIQVYVDDLTISTSDTLAHHTECVAEILRRLTKANLVVSAEKIVLAQTSIHLLGWTIVNGALLPDPRKVNTALQFPIPTNTRALNSFLGYMNFFRSSIPLYSHISSCLDKLRNVKDLQLHWTEVHTIAVRNLQKALSSAPLIHAIDYRYPLHVATDASNTGISGVLYMKVNNEVRYVAMASRSLSGSEVHFSTTRREILAVVYCFQRFSRWLVNKHFTLHVDHRSLIYLHSQQVPNHLLLTYYEVLFAFSYSVVHLPGHLNCIADAGSRLFADDFNNLQGGKVVNEKEPFILKKRDKLLLAANKPHAHIEKRTFKQRNAKKFKPQLNISSTFYKKALRQHAQEHSQNEQLIKHSPTNISTGSNNEPINIVKRDHKSTSKRDKLINSALRYADYITPPEKERNDIINRVHLFGHFGIKACETAIHRDYNMHWTNMRDDIHRIISNCPACSHYNISQVGFHPFRSVLPSQPLDHWSIDLGTFNTTSAAGNNYMLVMVDHFSRFTILRALPDKSSLTIAKELLNIFCLFSFPKVISHDHGSEFVNNIVSQLVLLSGIDRRVSLPYTPQGNSVCERFVGIAKNSIIKMLNGKHDSWDLYLNSVQLAMNTKYSKLHKSRPFAIVFNRQPNGFEDYSKVEHTLSTEKADTKLIDDRLAFAQEVVIPEITKLIKETQDKDHARFEKTHRIIRDMYPIGSTVMIQNVRRTSKLQERYSGPFTISGYTKNKSYILTDPQGNLLSRDIPTQQIKLINAKAPSQNEFKEGHFEVQAIIGHRGTPGNYNYLVHWLGYDNPEDNTWQTEQDFDSKHHIQLYWDRRNAGTNNKRPLPPSVNNSIRKRGTRDRHSNKNANVIRRSQRLESSS